MDPLSRAGYLQEVRALLRLDAMPDLGLRTILRLVEEFGSGRRALSAPASVFDQVCGRRLSGGRRDPALAVLAALEILGFVEQSPGLRFRRAV